MIAIIDYDVGNLGSVVNAFRYIGCQAEVSKDKEFILSADAVVLPGVGAFANAMENLCRTGMADVVKEVIHSNKPFLGICLGMQLLFDYSEEGGEKVEGLGVFKGSVRHLPVHKGLKIPHMGWNRLDVNTNCTLFSNLPKDPHAYFVHSYFVTAEERDIVAATTHYGIDFDVAVARGKIYAVQFHPEKSSEVGLTLLKNFACIAGMSN